MLPDTLNESSKIPNPACSSPSFDSSLQGMGTATFPPSPAGGMLGEGEPIGQTEVFHWVWPVNCHNL